MHFLSNSSKIVTSVVAGAQCPDSSYSTYASSAHLPTPRIWRFKTNWFQKKSPAFTLVELIVVLGIFAVLTSVVVYRYRDFNNNIILTNVAYEVGLLVRQAQVYGLSVRNAGGTSGFNQGYGVLINKTTNSFLLCADTHPLQPQGKNGDKKCEAIADTDTIVDSLKLPSEYTISGIQITEADGDILDTEAVSIVFLRPEPNAYIVDQLHGPDDRIRETQITVASPSGNKKTVIVWHTGQISVK